jgi:hypothetical protein
MDRDTNTDTERDMDRGLDIVKYRDTDMNMDSNRIGPG